MTGILARVATLATNRIYQLPVLVLMPHSRCNCRCIMCDIWKANHEKRELSADVVDRHLKAFRTLGVKSVALSGGEALLHSNLWKLCDSLRSISIQISLLSTGITLAHHAKDVVTHCDELIVSLDGPEEIHNKIRNLPNAFEKLAEGVQAVKRLNPGFRITGRSVIQKQNFRAFEKTVQAAQSIGLDQLSFLAADVSSTAFNRPDPWGTEKTHEVALTPEEANEMEMLVRNYFADSYRQLPKGFIAESEKKLLEIARYYQAVEGQGQFPRRKCNAPWVSAVIESNGDVLPCFFHEPYGNIHREPLESILNGAPAVTFRKRLNVDRNPVCQRCVCSLHVGLTERV